MDMDIHTLIDYCKKYQKLGWAVQAQLDTLLSGENLDDLNPNAVKIIDDFAFSLDPDIDAEDLHCAITDYNGS